MVADPTYRSPVFLLGLRRRPLADRIGAEILEEWLAFFGRFLEEPKNQQRHPVDRRMNPEGRIKGRCGLEGNKSHGDESLFLNRIVDPGQYRQHAVDGLGGNHFHRATETQPSVGLRISNQREIHHDRSIIRRLLIFPLKVALPEAQQVKSLTKSCSPSQDKAQ